MINPIEYYKSRGWYVTSPYGPRTGLYAGFHRGYDFGGYPCGASVHTPYAGVVTAARTSGMGTWGNTVCIKLDLDGQYTSLNAHLQTIAVKEGQRVESGDVIGTNGGTNHSGPNYGCHIHYEIQKTHTTPWRGDHLDPATFYLDQKPKELSTRFESGNIIYNARTARVNIRSEPGTNSQVLGSVDPNVEVQVKADINNGIYKDGYYWWLTSAGWVAEEFFNLLVMPDPEPIPPPELEIPEDLIPLIRLLVKKWGIEKTTKLLEVLTDD